ncbi:MAG TPA: hypothetical protein VH561_07130 [Micromonosporaceae bacterium]|jgi:hypothetical protein
MRAPTVVVRVGMAALGAVHAWWGVWARLFPRHFFANFPGFGRRWTAAYPPYNEHLVTDLGATFLTLAFLLFAGAWVRDRTVRAVSLVAVAIFSALHLTFHATNHASMGSADFATSLFFLILGVLAPVTLLVIDRLATPAPRQFGD